MAARNKQAADLLSIDAARSDYAMAKRSGAQKRRVRGVPSQGAGADYHYRSESDWLWMGELAWDIYRNNMVVGSIVDRAVEQQLQDGFGYNPDTGDKGLDADLVAWWKETAEDTSECDPANELTFADQTEMVTRSTLVAGDIFGLPMEDGTVELKEFHLCRTPTYNTREKKNIFHGVEKNPETRRRLAYHFLHEPIDPFKHATIKKDDLNRLPAYDEDGERTIFHVRFPKRTHQTRGLTAFAPIFDVAGYHDDVQFLTLVRARASSLFLFVEERLPNFDPAYLAAEMRLGVDATRNKAEEYEQNQRQYSEVGPASVLRGLPGASIKPWSANIPHAEFFAHSKLLLTFIGINLGMPLVMALMDASETNFSGYRGAVEQARMGFRKNQQRLVRRWHRPYLRFKILKRAEKDAAFARWIDKTENPRSKVNVFRHQWQLPAWPYINPMEDATSVLIRSANSQSSLRRLAAEQGMEWDELSTEIPVDRAKLTRNALIEAQKLIGEFNLPTTPEYLDVLAQRLGPLPNPERMQFSISSQLSQPKPAKPSEGSNDSGT